MTTPSLLAVALALVVTVVGQLCVALLRENPRSISNMLFRVAARMYPEEERVDQIKEWRSIHELIGQTDRPMTQLLHACGTVLSGLHVAAIDRPLSRARHWRSLPAFWWSDVNRRTADSHAPTLVALGVVLKVSAVTTLLATSVCHLVYLLVHLAFEPSWLPYGVVVYASLIPLGVGLVMVNDFVKVPFGPERSRDRLSCDIETQYRDARRHFRWADERYWTSLRTAMSTGEERHSSVSAHVKELHGLLTALLNDAVSEQSRSTASKLAQELEHVLDMDD